MTDASAWQDVDLAAAILALAPALVGGVALHGMPGPVRDAWLDRLRSLLAEDAPVRRLPLHVTESRLLGGLDLAATLNAGRPVAERGLLAECGGGIVVMAMAERAARSTVAHLAAVLDHGEIVVERDGFSAREPTQLGVVALDESLADDDGLSGVLGDRLALHLDLAPYGIHDVDEGPYDAAAVALGRRRLPDVAIADEAHQRLCTVAASLGIASLRACLLASRVARVSAALHGRGEVDEPDLAVAARLVLAPRATVLPLPPEEPQPPEEAPEPPPSEQPPESEAEDRDNTDALADQPLEDQVLAAALAAIPPDVLAMLRSSARSRLRAQTSGKSGELQRSRLRGRPTGAMRGPLRAGARLSLIDTLRAAAPWQRLRRAEESARPRRQAHAPAVLVRPDDFRVTRYKQRSETTTIFVVDASGSAALHRLAEAKGAVEMLLADCYVRRDQVALIAFRGREADILLPPTRSLVRAKRSIAALPGGGGTPLAAGIDAAAGLADLIQRRGGTPAVIVLTDGRANVARDGAPGRQRAFEEALDSGAVLRGTGVRSMVIDTAPRPHVNAERLAESMGGVYLPLPHADAAALSRAVQAGT
jgi:magnesium chelatase subunit D